MALERGCLGLSWTFNEPTLWLEYTLDGARQAKSRGLYTNTVTNGYITRRPSTSCPTPRRLPGRHQGVLLGDLPEVANISDPEGIRCICERARGRGIHVELVTNVIPGYNDDEWELTNIAHWIRERLGADVPGTSPVSTPTWTSPTSPRPRSRPWSEPAKSLWMRGSPTSTSATCPARCREHLLRWVRGTPDRAKRLRDPSERIQQGRCPECGTAIPGRFF